MSDRKALVVYYSRSGTTRALADLITAALDADVEELRDVHGRHGARGWLRSIFEATLARPAAIQPQRWDPSRYDLVVVGTPVWNARVSSPVRAWLRDNAGRLPQVAFFATMGGRGGEAAVAQMTELAGKLPCAMLVATADRVLGGHAIQQVAAFVRTLVRPPTFRPSPPAHAAPAHAH